MVSYYLMVIIEILITHNIFSRKLQLLQIALLQIEEYDIINIFIVIFLLLKYLQYFGKRNMVNEFV